MRVGIYDPYLDSLGGGERYVLILAEFLSHKNEVEIFWHDGNIRKLIEERLDIKTDKIKFVANIFTHKKNLIQKFSQTCKYDLIFFLSDGSIPTIFAKKGILHFQVPFVHVNGRTMSNKIKLSRFQSVVCNSHFTKEFIDRTYGIESLVVYPPVDVKNFKPLIKKNFILSVGRFTNTLHNKKQEVMIETFREISPKIKDWELVLAGGAVEADKSYLGNLRKLAYGLPIKIVPNASFAELKTLYGQAKIYWHAAGFGEDEDKNPERMEHFGITTVEAMASGCVPVVFFGGGQKEIIKNEENGFFWSKPEELKAQTLVLAKDEKRRDKIALAAQKRSGDFSQEKFYGAFSEIIYH